LARHEQRQQHHKPISKLEHAEQTGSMLMEGCMWAVKQTPKLKERNTQS
jgi:hypothetical protein